MVVPVSHVDVSRGLVQLDRVDQECHLKPRAQEHAFVIRILVPVHGDRRVTVWVRCRVVQAGWTLVGLLRRRRLSAEAGTVSLEPLYVDIVGNSGHRCRGLECHDELALEISGHARVSGSELGYDRAFDPQCLRIGRRPYGGAVSARLSRQDSDHK